jgi:hypothetical protein
MSAENVQTVKWGIDAYNRATSTASTSSRSPTEQSEQRQKRACRQVHLQLTRSHRQAWPGPPVFAGFSLA